MYELAEDSSLVPVSVGPRAMEQVKLLIFRARGTIITGSLGCAANSGSSSSSSTSAGETATTPTESDVELWKFIEWRTQGGEGEEEEEEEEEDEELEDEDGNPIERPPKPPPPEKPAEFESSMFVGGAVAAGVTQTWKNSELPFSGVFGGSDFLLRWLSGSRLPVLDAIGQRPYEKKEVVTQ